MTNNIKLIRENRRIAEDRRKVMRIGDEET